MKELNTKPAINRWLDYLLEGYDLLRTITRAATPETVLLTCFMIGMFISTLIDMHFHNWIPPNIQRDLHLTTEFFLATVFASLIMLLVFSFREDKKQFLSALGKPIRAGIGMGVGLCAWPNILATISLMLVYATIVGVIIFIVFSIRRADDSATLPEEKS